MRIAALTLMAWAVFAVNLPGRAQGGCATQSLDKYLEHTNVVAIFRATVTAVKPVRQSLSFPRDRREIAAMRVTRIWKGTVALETALLHWFQAGAPQFQLGAESLVIAHELSPESRQWFGLPATGARALGVNGLACDAMTVDRPAAIRIMEAAAGYAPQP